MSNTAALPTPLSVSLPSVQIPLREILPWALFVGVLSMITLYFVGAEDGALAVFSGGAVHEFLHDGRHLLAFPCH